METSPKLGPYNYRFGLIASGIGIAFSLMLYFMDMTYNQSPVIQTTQTLIPAVVAVIAILAFKKDNGGLLSLKQSIKIGIGVFLIAGIVGIIYFALFINFLEPEFITKTAQLQADAMRASMPELDESVIEMQQENTEKFFYVSFPFILIMNVLIGLVVGLVTGLFAKNK